MSASYIENMYGEASVTPRKTSSTPSRQPLSVVSSSKLNSSGGLNSGPKRVRAAKPSPAVGGARGTSPRTPARDAGYMQATASAMAHAR